MQIAQARQKASNHLASHLLKNPARRPDPEARVMTRFPLDHGKLITAGNPDQLHEKLAKQIQAFDRRQSRQ